MRGIGMNSGINISFANERLKERIARTRYDCEEWNFGKRAADPHAAGLFTHIPQRHCRMIGKNGKNGL